MGVLQPDFTLSNGRIPVTQVNLTGSNAFNFAASQHHARLKHLINMIVVPGLSIGRQDFYATFFSHKGFHTCSNKKLIAPKLRPANRSE
jgi:hypothetical protein